MRAAEATIVQALLFSDQIGEEKDSKLKEELSRLWSAQNKSEISLACSRCFKRWEDSTGTIGRTEFFSILLELSETMVNTSPSSLFLFFNC